MDIDGLKTFVAIAELGGFTRAGGRLHRSQPAISRRIELLEREFDIPLFERLRGGTILTDAGAAFLPYAESVLAAADDSCPQTDFRNGVRSLPFGFAGSLMEGGVARSFS